MIVVAGPLCKTAFAGGIMRSTGLLARRPLGA